MFCGLLTPRASPQTPEKQHRCSPVSWYTRVTYQRGSKPGERTLGAKSPHFLAVRIHRWLLFEARDHAADGYCTIMVPHTLAETPRRNHKASHHILSRNMHQELGPESRVLRKKRGLNAVDRRRVLPQARAWLTTNMLQTSPQRCIYPHVRRGTSAQARYSNVVFNSIRLIPCKSGAFAPVQDDGQHPRRKECRRPCLSVTPVDEELLLQVGEGVIERPDPAACDVLNARNRTCCIFGACQIVN